jgi:hypothetical protein
MESPGPGGRAAPLAPPGLAAPVLAVRDAPVHLLKEGRVAAARHAPVPARRLRGGQSIILPRPILG